MNGYFDDIDPDVITGKMVVQDNMSVQESIQREKEMSFKGTNILFGVVIKQNDNFTVDINLGEVDDDGTTGTVYKQCFISSNYSENESGELSGKATLPKKGDRVIFGFANNQEQHPIILGKVMMPINTKAQQDIKNQTQEEDFDIKTDSYERIGKIHIIKKADGAVVLKNDKAEIRMTADGKIDIGDPNNFEKTVLGEKLKNWITDSINVKYNAHTHQVQQVLPLLPSGAGPVPVQLPPSSTGNNIPVIKDSDFLSDNNRNS